MSCTGARLTDVTRRAVAALQQSVDPASGVTIERAYAPDWLDPDYWKNNPDLQTKFTGRRVYVFGATQRQTGPADRGHDLNEYGVAVVVLERYEGVEPEVPLDWLDERLAWVEREIYDRLGNARGETVVPDAWSESQEWTVVYSPDLLRSNKLFRSEVTVQLRRIDAG